jgi:hypothetical protein
MEMIKNQMYEKSITLLFKNDKVAGWMATDAEADLFCQKRPVFSWDFYYPHKNYVSLAELPFMTIYS